VFEYRAHVHDPPTAGVVHRSGGRIKRVIRIWTQLEWDLRPRAMARSTRIYLEGQSRCDRKEQQRADTAFHALVRCQALIVRISIWVFQLRSFKELLAVHSCGKFSVLCTTFHIQSYNLRRRVLESVHLFNLKRDSADELRSSSILIPSQLHSEMMKQDLAHPQRFNGTNYA
jgi:hypothetical protein